MIGLEDWHDLNTFQRLHVTCQVCQAFVARVVRFGHGRHVGALVGKRWHFVFSHLPIT